MKMYVLNKVKNNINLLLNLMIIKFFGKIFSESYLLNLKGGEHMKMKKGFTLVELLIVLAVIAALLSVATPLALNAVKKAKASQVAQNFRAIKSAVENWFNTESPADPKTEFSKDTLLKKNYINTWPDGFEVTPEASNTGVYEFTIKYTKGDISLVDVEKSGMPEVDEGENNNLVLKFALQKWW
jgi:prepilin-type N-terminal cleavage/methylation domain-containing protein